MRSSMGTDARSVSTTSTATPASSAAILATSGVEESEAVAAADEQMRNLRRFMPGRVLDFPQLDAGVAICSRRFSKRFLRIPRHPAFNGGRRVFKNETT